jgi:hypothetical protein
MYNVEEKFLSCLTRHSQYNKKVKEFDADITDVIIYVFVLIYAKKWSVHRHVCIVFSPNQPISHSEVDERTGDEC